MRTFWIITRWVAAVVAALVGLRVALWISIESGPIIWPIWSRYLVDEQLFYEFMENSSAVLAASLFVLGGSWVAPQRRGWEPWIFFCLGLALAAWVAWQFSLFQAVYPYGQLLPLLAAAIAGAACSALLIRYRRWTALRSAAKK